MVGLKDQEELVLKELSNRLPQDKDIAGGPSGNGVSKSFNSKLVRSRLIQIRLKINKITQTKQDLGPVLFCVIMFK